MQQIDQLLRDHNLTDKKSAIMEALENSIKLNKVKMDEEDIPLGVSKMGGSPDLPEGWEFPSYKDNYLTFLVQINLSEVKAYDKNNLLPEQGMLYLFYEALEQPWGFEEDEGCFKVLYFEGDMEELVRKESLSNRAEFVAFPAFKLSFEHIVTLSEDPEGLDFSNENEEEGFWNLRGELMQPEDKEGNVEPANYMLGAPLSIQNDVFEDLFEDGKEPVLLFQIDSDEELSEMTWGDCGMLYFCMEKEDLVNKQFDKVKFTLQCY